MRKFHELARLSESKLINPHAELQSEFQKMLLGHWDSPSMIHSLLRRNVFGMLAVSACLAGVLPGMAWGFDRDKPLRVILPVSAGSGVDTIMRAAQPSLSRALSGQAVVIENMPGAGGITGTSALVRAAPDGQTIAVVSNNHAVNPSVFKKMPYDSLTDIKPISVLGETPFVLVVNPSKLPARNAKELQALLKARPGAYNYGSTGNGTIIHLAGEMFVSAAGADVRHVPYKGFGPMLTDIVGGQVEMAVIPVPAAQGHLKSGALRAIGVMGRQRVPSLSEVIPMVEQGFPNVDIAGWFAVIGPAKLPTEEVSRLHGAFVQTFSMPDVQGAMAKQENIIAPTTPDMAAAFFKSEQERYGRLVKKANIALD